MSKFNEGDQVVCIKDDVSGYLSEGLVYTVYAVTDVYLTIETPGPNYVVMDDSYFAPRGNYSVGDVVVAKAVEGSTTLVPGDVYVISEVTTYPDWTRVAVENIHDFEYNADMHFWPAEPGTIKIKTNRTYNKINSLLEDL